MLAVVGPGAARSLARTTHRRRARGCRRRRADELGSTQTSFSPEIRAAYVDALRDEGTVHAICEEYRAAATLDRIHDEDDVAADRGIRCPTLVLWSEDGPLDLWYQDDGGPLGIWRRWANTVTGHAIAGGHFFLEENPTETTSALQAFLKQY